MSFCRFPADTGAKSDHVALLGGATDVVVGEVERMLRRRQREDAQVEGDVSHGLVRKFRVLFCVGGNENERRNSIDWWLGNRARTMWRVIECHRA